MVNPFALFLEFTTFGKVIFLASFVLVAYFGILRSGLSLAPWVPTHKKDLARVNKLCNLKPGDVFIEAGCGNAVVTRYIAKHNPQVTCIGIEYSFIMFLWAKCVASLSPIPNLEIRYGDVLTHDLRHVTVVYSYGLTKTINQKLLPKIKRELPPGARFISYAFKIHDENVVLDGDVQTTNIYVYTNK